MQRCRSPLAATLIVAAMLAATSCSGVSEADALRPVDATGRGDGPGAAPASTTGRPNPAPPTSAAPTPTVHPGDGTTPDGDGTTTAALVDAVLARYDRALTALLRDPSAVVRPGDPVATAWRATIAPGSVLADDMSAVAAQHAASNREVVPPRGLDRSYVHRALTVEPRGERSGDAAGSIAFTWCGWSPGIVRDRGSGRVLDDGVAHATGTGTLSPVVPTTPGGPAWVLGALDESTIDVLPAGSADPCPGRPR